MITLPSPRLGLSLALFGLVGAGLLLGIGAGATAFPTGQHALTGLPRNGGLMASTSGGGSGLCRGTATLTASPALLAIGQSTLLHVRIAWAPGTPSVCFVSSAYTYLGLPLGCASQNQPTLVCAPGYRGTYTVTVHVSEPSSAVLTAQKTLKVI